MNELSKQVQLVRKIPTWNGSYPNSVHAIMLWVDYQFTSKIHCVGIIHIHLLFILIVYCLSLYCDCCAGQQTGVTFCWNHWSGKHWMLLLYYNSYWLFILIAHKFFLCFIGVISNLALIFVNEILLKIYWLVSMWEWMYM